MSDKIREAFNRVHAKIIDGNIASAFSIFKDGYEAGAALAQQATQAAPDVWRLVPVEPTREMWAAAGDCVTTLQWSGIGHHDKISSAVYRAMLAAAPAAPAPEPEPEPEPQEPVAFYWQDLDAFPLTARRHGPYFGWPSEDVIARCQHDAKPIPLYAAPPAAEQQHSTTSDKIRADLYDEAWEKASALGFGNVTDALAELQRTKLAEQPDTVKVRELIDLVMRCDITGGGVLAAQRAAHALLGKEGA